MPTLSNGIRVTPTSQRTSEGNLIYVSDAGGLYTFQSGKWVESRKPSNSPALQESLNTLRERGDSEAADTVLATQTQLRASIPPTFSYEVPDLNEFLDEGRKQAASFFEPQRQLNEERIKYAEEVAQQVRDTGIARTEEDKTAFTGLQDRKFASLIQDAQSGFAGRGLSTSGIRRGVIEEKRQANEDTVNEKFTEFLRDTQDYGTAFARALKESGFDTRQNEISTAQAIEAKAIATAQARQQEQLLQNREAREPFNDFMEQKASA